MVKIQCYQCRTERQPYPICAMHARMPVWCRDNNCLTGLAEWNVGIEAAYILQVLQGKTLGKDHTKNDTYSLAFNQLNWI